jgi:ABC-type polysaccharide/polyol phosphate export permease
VPSGVAELFSYREFLKQIVLQQMRSRYRGSVLGFLWTLLNPLLVFAILSFIFSYLNGWDLRTSGVYFFAGYVPWMFFNNATNGAPYAIVGNTLYVTRIYAPRLVFPISLTAVNAVDLAAGMCVLFAMALLMGAPVSSAWAIIPAGAVLLVVFTAGLCLLFAATGVFLRDFQFLWSNLSFLLFFLSPILFPLERIPQPARAILELNPVLPFLQLFQEPLIHGRLPWGAIPKAVILAGASVTLGYAAFTRTERRFYLYL